MAQAVELTGSTPEQLRLTALRLEATVITATVPMVTKVLTAQAATTATNQNTDPLSQQL